MAPEGTRFAELGLPPDSVTKPYFKYVVDGTVDLPPGWRIEQSQSRRGSTNQEAEHSIGFWTNPAKMVC